MPFRAFKMKKQGFKTFFKQQIRNDTPLKRGFKRLSGVYSEVPNERAGRLCSVFSLKRVLEYATISS